MKKDSKKIIKFLNTNFPGWKTNPFLKFNYSITKGFKYFCMYGVNVVYKWNRPMIFIRPYKFMIDKLNIDIKF